MTMKEFTYTITERCAGGEKTFLMFSSYPSPIDRGTGYCFQSISLFVCLYVSLFLSFFVSLLARLRQNGWTDLHEIFMEGAE